RHRLRRARCRGVDVDLGPAGRLDVLCRIHPRPGLKEQDPRTGEYRGGPAFYIEKAYRHTKARGLFKVYGMVFAAVTVLAMSFMLPGIQSNAISGAIENAWNVPTWATAIALVII